MQINFTAVKIENFMSIDKADIVLDGVNTVLVTGSNNSSAFKSNGAGKSSLFEAILWCVTGNTLRSTMDVVNRYTGAPCSVTTRFSVDGVDYVVTRSKDAKAVSRLNVVKNDVDISGKGIRQTESILEGELKDISYQYLCLAVFFGQGLPYSFSSNIPSRRKELLECLTHSDYMIEDLRTRVQDRKNVLDSGVLDYTNWIRLKASTIESLMKEIDNAKVELETISANKRTSVDLMHDKYHIDELDARQKNKIDEKYSLSEDMRAIDVRITQLSGERDLALSKLQNSLSEDKARLQSAKREASKELVSVNHYLNQLRNKGICPTCGQRLSEECQHNLDLKHEQAISFTTQISIIDSEIYKLESEYEVTRARVVEPFVGEISQLESKLVELKCKIDAVNSEILSLDVELRTRTEEYEASVAASASSEATCEALRQRIKECKQKIDEETNAIKELKDTVSEYEIRRDINKKFTLALNRDFRGILLKNIISWLDNKCKDYAQVVFGNRCISISIEGNNISIKLDDREIESLSGGERRRVDLIVQFSIRSLLLTYFGCSCNILVLDEIFDNLDMVGCESVLKLVNTLSVPSIFIISHRADLPITYDGKILVTKQGCISSVIQS